jgi:hypothetical protein
MNSHSGRMNVEVMWTVYSYEEGLKKITYIFGSDTRSRNRDWYHTRTEHEEGILATSVRQFVVKVSQSFRLALLRVLTDSDCPVTCKRREKQLREERSFKKQL